MYYVNILYMKNLDKISSILIMTISIVLLLTGKPKNIYIYYIQLFYDYISLEY